MDVGYGADDPALLLVHWKFYLRSITNAIIDAKIHCDGMTEEEAVEMIDVGGPSMLRGAAKNFAHVAPVCRPERYESVLAELRDRGDISSETRRALAAEAFATTAVRI